MVETQKISMETKMMVGMKRKCQLRTVVAATVGGSVNLSSFSITG